MCRTPAKHPVMMFQRQTILTKQQYPRLPAWNVSFRYDRYSTVECPSTGCTTTPGTATTRLSRGESWLHVAPCHVLCLCHNMCDTQSVHHESAVYMHDATVPGPFVFWTYRTVPKQATAVARDTSLSQVEQGDVVKAAIHHVSVWY